MLHKRQFWTTPRLLLLAGLGLVVYNYEVIMNSYMREINDCGVFNGMEGFSNSTTSAKLIQDLQAEVARLRKRGGGGTSTGGKRNGPLNYLRDTDEVIKVFKDCANDPYCYFTYHHVAKTGGTTVEENMFPRFEQPIELTCCHGRMLEKFRNETERYCAEKFTSWQVSKNKFTEIVETCHKIRPKSRTVVWTTFREPISTYVSLVHQMCNKNVYKREPHHARACEVCDFTNETAPVWLEYAQSVELQIKGAYHTSHYFLNDDRVTSVTMEPNDLNGFWKAFTNDNMRPSNKEENSLCSFRPTSQLVKSLREAQDVYRRLVSGLDVEDEVINRFNIFKVENFGRCRKNPKCLEKVVKQLGYI